MDDIQELSFALQVCRQDICPPSVFAHLYTVQGLLRGIQDGQLQAFLVVDQLGEQGRSLAPALVAQVLQCSTGSSQQGRTSWNHQQLQQSHAPPSAAAQGLAGKDSGSGNDRCWHVAVRTLASIWPASCHLLDPETVLEVLQRVAQVVMQDQQQRQPSPGTWSSRDDMHIQDLIRLLRPLRPHANLVAAVLQHSGFVRQLAAVVAGTGSAALADAMGAVVAASVVPLRELPAAHAAVCELLSSGLQQGARLLSGLTPPEVQQRLGLWQDPVLQAACVEGAHRAAAAVREAVASSSSGQGAVDSSGGSLSEQQQAMAGQGLSPGNGPVAQVGAAIPSGGPSVAVTLDHACSTCYGYTKDLVRLVEGQHSTQQPLDLHISKALVAAAWQGVTQLSDALRPVARSGHHFCGAWDAGEVLLCSPAARQLLMQQPGGVCSMEEVCSVLGRALAVHCCSRSLDAVVRLLQGLDMSGRGAMLAVPGFAQAVVKHALGYAVSTNSPAYGVQPSVVAALLGLLVGDSTGRAVLLAEPDALGHLAWHVAECVGEQPCSPHLAQLWAEGGENGVAGGMVAGLAAGGKAWVQFFGWVISKRPVQEWCELEDLPDALGSAFSSDHPGERMSPLEQVLRWMLEKEEGRLLLSGRAGLCTALSGWLQRHAHQGRDSPLMVLIEDVMGDQSHHPDLAAAVSWLGQSFELCKAAVVSLVTCHEEADTQGILAGRLVRQQLQQQQIVEDRGLLCILLKAAVAKAHWSGNGVAMRALAELPRKQVLPVLLQLLGEDDPGPTPDGPPGNGSTQQPAPAAAAAAGGSSATPAAVDTQVPAGAWVALEQIRASSAKGQKQLLAAMRQLVKDAGRVRELQQVEAAGHVALVAAAQARQQLAAEEQQLQQERELIRQEQQRLEEQRAALAAQQQQLDEREASVATQQLQLQEERAALQLLQAGTEAPRQGKRRQL